MFDAVLIVSFGGPQSMDDIRPFLANVLRGRPVPTNRIEEVAQRLSCGRTTVYGLLNSGELRSVKLGNSRRVLVDDLEN